jgi:indolepyruvate ferredoxin oxidoreductase
MTPDIETTTDRNAGQTPAQAPADPSRKARPVKLTRPDVSLTDKYELEQGTIFLSGIQALVRVMLDQHRADARRGVRTATFASGYQGSPLGGLDKEIMRLRGLAADHLLHFVPGLNEELAATAVYGTQLAMGLPDPKYDGVVGVWYGKNPGLDRAMDAIRHANFAGTSPTGGVLALVGDDPSCKSSTLPSAGEATLASLQIPTVFPGTLQEVLDLGLHAIACSRASGLWSAMKVVANTADAAGTAQVWPERVVPVMPQVEWEGRPYRHTPSGNLLAPASLELERTMFGVRLEIARQYAQLNQLNPISLPTRDAWIGIVAAGKVYYELLQALRDMGLDHRELERAGVRLMKVGMLYPHDDQSFREFARGLEEIVVVEEKLPFLETAVKDALYGTPNAPRVVGKRDEHGAELLTPVSDLDADQIAVAVASRLEHRVSDELMRPRLEQISAQRSALRRAPLPLARTPFFCSGCPHNTSTANPDDTLLGVGIGCHTMVLLSPEGKGTVTGITQMGGEGAQFVGMQPFTEADHFVQNVGDGTFHHSASLAIRFASASGANVTYKILYNDTVAMTGGQDVLGQLKIPELTRWLELEGVKEIAITTGEPRKWRGENISSITKVHHRDDLAEVQAGLAKVKGVTVLIHDQPCAAELRRARKRGKAVDPPKRIYIDERVCEGCGDCGTKSNCLSVLPVDTEFGRKTEIHQASCNKDYSCVKGDCPSFLEVVQKEGQSPQSQTRLRGLSPESHDLPEPVMRVPRDDFMVRMPGVGGTGVVTVSQIVGMAAMLDGRFCSGLDQTGLSQKGGPVISDIRISRDRIEGSNKASAASIDVLLGFDLLGAANPKNLMTADPERTVAVVSTTKVPTASMVTDTGVRFPALDRNLSAIRKATRGEELAAIDAQGLSEALFGDHMPTNTLLIGAAYQHGCLPISAEAIEEAIRLNGASVEKNLAAFRWGRAVIARPELAEEILHDAPELPEVSPQAAAIIDATGAQGELRRLLEIRVPDLIGYQNERYARRYAEQVADVARIEAERGAPGETAVAELYARNLYKLMAYKDEYEVARLHLLGDKPEGKVRYLLHPPLLRAMGLKHKLRIPSWMMRPGFRVLRSLKGLRGKPFDLFGYAEVRRVERKLIGEYEGLVEHALVHLDPATHGTVAEIAGLPDVIRGYEHIKLANVERFRAEAERLTRELG